MRALVIKPTPCCKSGENLGKVIDVAPLPDSPERGIMLECDCGNVSHFNPSALYDVVGYQNTAILRERVQILPDGVDADNLATTELEVVACGH